MTNKQWITVISWEIFIKRKKKVLLIVCTHKTHIHVLPVKRNSRKSFSLVIICFNFEINELLNYSHKLYTTVPDKSYVCSYPFSAKQQQEQNQKYAKLLVYFSVQKKETEHKKFIFFKWTIKRPWTSETVSLLMQQILRVCTSTQVCTQHQFYESSWCTDVI